MRKQLRPECCNTKPEVITPAIITQTIASTNKSQVDANTDVANVKRGKNTVGDTQSV